MGLFHMGRCINFIKRIFRRKKLLLVGRGRLRVVNRRTGELVKVTPWKEDLVLTCGKELICQMLMDVAGYDTGLTWFAIGDDDTTPALAQTTLVSEQHREEILESGKSRIINVLTFSTLIPAADCSFHIKEVGICGHSTATAAADSGIFFDRWLEDEDNTAGDNDLIPDYELTVG